MMRAELVDREKWVTPERFRRVLGVYQALPGPEATEMACYFGMLRHGRLGAVAAGLGFILPGLVLMLVASWLYVRYGVEHAAVQSAFAWCRPAVIGLMVLGCMRLTQKTIIGEHVVVLAVVGCAAGAAHWLGAAFWIGLIGAGVVTALAARRRWVWMVIAGVVWVGAMGWSERMNGAVAVVAPLPNAGEPTQAASGLEIVPMGMWGSPPAPYVAMTGLEAGLLTFGGAYTAIPVVEARAVKSPSVMWLTREQFLDALAIGGVLPAPLIIFGTMVGYLGGGWLGAMLMTVGIFLPAFGFTLIGHKYFERLVDEPRAHAFLEGVAAAAVGIMTVVTIRIGLETLTTPRGVGIAAAALVVLVVWKSKLATPVVVLGAAVLGTMIQ